MSLRDAVVDIANQIEADIESAKGADVLNGSSVRMMLVGYVRQLRTAAKAAEGEAKPSVPADWMHKLIGSQEQAVAAQSAAKQRTKEVEKAETLLNSLVICEGGSSDGDMIPVQGMPVDAFTMINGEVYQLQSDGKLHFRADKTSESRKKSSA